jgi:hypothetical protein
MRIGLTMKQEPRIDDTIPPDYHKRSIWPLVAWVLGLVFAYAMSHMIVTWFIL